MKRSMFILAAVILSFAIGAACGYMAGAGRRAMTAADNSPGSEPSATAADSISPGSERSDTAADSSPGSEPSAAAASVKPAPAVPAIRGVFSWHIFEPAYRDVLETHHIDQVYQCYDEALHKRDYDSVRENLKLLDGYDVWLLTGDPSWGAEEMLEMVALAKDVGGFRGVVFDVEPKEFDHSYIHSVQKTCASSSLDLMFCLPYWAEDEIVAEVMAVADGVMAMNYDKGHEGANIASWIDMAGKKDVPLITIYELQPPNDKYDLKESGTYDGDAAACEKNFAEQFAGTEGLGIAFHYIKYL